MNKIELTLEELENLLDEQKELTIEKLLSHSSMYNQDNTESSLKSLAIDEEKFKKYGLQAKYPSDFNILCKYLKY